MVRLPGITESPLKITCHPFGSYIHHVFLRRALRQRLPCRRVDLVGCCWLEHPGLWAHSVGGVTSLCAGRNTIGRSQTQWDVHSASGHQRKGEEGRMSELLLASIWLKNPNVCVFCSTSSQLWAAACTCTAFWPRRWWPTGRLPMTLMSYIPCCYLTGNIRHFQIPVSNLSNRKWGLRNGLFEKIISFLFRSTIYLPLITSVNDLLWEHALWPNLALEILNIIQCCKWWRWFLMGMGMNTWVLCSFNISLFKCSQYCNDINTYAVYIL